MGQKPAEPVKIRIPPEKLAAAISRHFTEPLLKQLMNEQNLSKEKGA